MRLEHRSMSRESVCTWKPDAVFVTVKRSVQSTELTTFASSVPDRAWHVPFSPRSPSLHCCCCLHELDRTIFRCSRIAARLTTQCDSTRLRELVASECHVNKLMNDDNSRLMLRWSRCLATFFCCAINALVSFFSSSLSLTLSSSDLSQSDFPDDCFVLKIDASSAAIFAWAVFSFCFLAVTLSNIYTQLNLYRIVYLGVLCLDFQN